jgi:hypothetical protein
VTVAQFLRFRKSHGYYKQYAPSSASSSCKAGPVVCRVSHSPISRCS